MRLVSRSYGDTGDKPRLIILHGLLGSLRNWHTTALQLGKRLHVTSLDLRNHGESPHHSIHTLDAMSADVESWMDEQDLDSAYILGHSMGGKVAMRMASSAPDRIIGLIVLDIAPRAYASGSVELDSMRRLDLKALKSRRDADRALAPSISDPRHRQFLLTNLGYDKAQGFFWKANIKALGQNLDAIRESPMRDGDMFGAPTHVISGGASPYVSDDDRPLFELYFASLKWTVIPDSGHNPHMDNRDVLVPLILESCGVGS